MAAKPPPPNQLLPLAVGTGIFGVMFIMLPCCVKKGPNQGIIRCSLLLTIFSLWIFWATVYISQMHPLIGPRHKNTTLIWYRQKIEKDSPTTTTTTTTIPTPPPPDELTSSGPGPGGLPLRSSYCRDQPNNLFECCNIPWIPKAVQVKCFGEVVDFLTLTCTQARCAFQEADWLERAGVVKREKVAAYYDKVAADDQEWSHAVRLIQTECMDNVTIKNQGIYTDCPEYDIIYCALIRMFKNAPLPNWSTAAACVPTQQFMSICPICPEDCNKIVNQEDTARSILCVACSTF